MKLLLTLALYAVLAGLIATRPRADDLDIYLERGGATASPLRVMLSLDLRAGAAATICTDAGASQCRTRLGEELYAQLDLFGPTGKSPPVLPVEHSADGVADREQTDPANPAASLAEVYWPGVLVEYYDALRAALRLVLTRTSLRLRDAPPARRVEVGLLAQHADDCAGAGPEFVPDYSLEPATGCSQGAYVLVGLADLADPDHLQRLLRALAALPDPGRRAPWMTTAWTGHPYKLRDTYLELYRYLSGQAVFNGFLGSRDYGSRLGGNLYHTLSTSISNDVLPNSPDGSANQPLLAPDPLAVAADTLDLANNRVAGARYTSPVAPGESCPRVTLVNILAGATSGSQSDTDAAIAAPNDQGGLAISLAPGAAGDRALLARMASEHGTAVSLSPSGWVPVASYVFSLDAGSDDDALAAAGGTDRAYSLGDPRDLIAALELILDGGGAASRSLVAGATVANLGAQGDPVQDIYYALFQPGAGSGWPGNVKKLKLVAATIPDSETTTVAQAPLTQPPIPGLSGEDGQVLSDALTFWTDPTGADVLGFDPERDEVPGRDGRSVTRGGAGQQVTGYLSDSVGSANSEPGARQLFTLDPQVPGTLLGFDATPAVAASIGPYLDPDDILSQSQKLDLIRWIRGQDSYDADGDQDLIESRAWLLAGILHSRPLAISYGARPGTSYSRDNPDVRLFFGSVDGMFHVLRNTEPSGAESGAESWAFIPPTMLGNQLALAQARPDAFPPHHYGIDGEPVALIRDRDRDGTIDTAEGDSVWLFIGQRRGGRGLYAFDVSDPDHPRFMWHIDPHSPGFGQLALTFSTPRVAMLDTGTGSAAPVLLFAGGYNGGWSGSSRVGKDAGESADLAGNAVYVVNPSDGRLLWRAVGPDGGPDRVSDEQVLVVPGLIHSIPSPVSVVDSDHNGVDDRAYVGDTGGNVWRIDFTESSRLEPDAPISGTGSWRITRLAQLGGGGESDRRFFHAPDLVQSRDAGGDYLGVVIVAGDRASPLGLNGRNFAYLLKDRSGTAGGAPASAEDTPVFLHGDLADITATCSDPATDACAGADFAAGWKLALEAPGEKGFSAPLITNGTVMFTSYVPVDGEQGCAVSPGVERLYAVRLGNGAPSPLVAGKLKLPGEEEISARFEELGPGAHGGVEPFGSGVLIPGSGLEEQPFLQLAGRYWWRIYWREEGVDVP